MVITWQLDGLGLEIQFTTRFGVPDNNMLPPGYCCRRRIEQSSAKVERMVASQETVLSSTWNSLVLSC